MYTLSGYGIYRCGNQRKVLGPGQVFAYRSPDRGQISIERGGLPWHTVCIHVNGAPALALFDHIINEFGMFHELPPDCTAVKLARKLPRYAAQQSLRSPHFWSKHTYAFLDAWWECAQNTCGSLSTLLREAPHDSQLLGLTATNIKSLAEQLGFSRSHLARKLKWQWDKPPGAVLRAFRMEEAAKLLRMSDLSVGSIAIKLGFSTSSALTRAFKKAYDASPLEYRAAQGNGNSRVRRPGKNGLTASSN